MHAMKNWQGIPTTHLTLGGEVLVPRDNRTLVFSSERLLNYIIPFSTQGKIRHYTSDMTGYSNSYHLIKLIHCNAPQRDVLSDKMVF